VVDLKPIYEYANEVLANLKPGEVEGAINWGDLSCTDVQECRSVHDNYASAPTVRVTIEEASPDNQELCQHMFVVLNEKFQGIFFEISTEW
jgi:hypothetical protein